MKTDAGNKENARNNYGGLLKKKTIARLMLNRNKNLTPDNYQMGLPPWE